MAIDERAVCTEIKDYLNSNISNLNTSRPTGSQFFTTYEEISFKRPDTFPKGEVFVFNDDETTKNLGRNRKVVKNNSYGVYCYVGAGQKYTSGSITYQDEGLCQYMTQQVHDSFTPQDILGSISFKIVAVTQDNLIERFTEAGHSYLRGLVVVSSMRVQ
jgi:hypothetical protein